MLRLKHAQGNVLILPLLPLTVLCPPYVAPRRHVLIILLLGVHKLFDLAIVVNELHRYRGPVLSSHLLDHGLKVRHVYLFCPSGSLNICLTLLHGSLHFLEPFDVVDQPEVPL